MWIKLCTVMVCTACTPAPNPQFEMVLLTLECHGLLPANFCRYISKKAKIHNDNQGQPQERIAQPISYLLTPSLIFVNPLVKLQGIGVPADSCHLLLGFAKMYAAAISAPQLYPFSLRWEAYMTNKGLIRTLHANLSHCVHSVGSMQQRPFSSLDKSL